MQPSPLPPIPESAAAVARAAFRRGNRCLKSRDELGALYEDADFAALFPRRGQPALPRRAQRARRDCPRLASGRRAIRVACSL